MRVAAVALAMLLVVVSVHAGLFDWLLGTEEETINEPIVVQEQPVTKSAHPRVVYDKYSETVCEGTRCTKKIFSGQQYIREDGRWKNISEAKSLKGTNIICNVDYDGVIDVVCGDWNWTSVYLENISVESNKVPVRIYYIEDNGYRNLTYSADINKKRLEKISQKIDFTHPIFQDKDITRYEIHLGESSTNITIYPETSDGDLTYTDVSWDTAHDAATAEQISSVSGTFQFGTELISSTYYIRRGFMAFDTSSIPINAKNIEANACMYIHTHADTDNDAQAYVAVTVPANTATLADLAVEDYDSLGDTIAGDVVDLSSLSANSWFCFALNQTGIDELDFASYSQFGFREGHDLEDDPVSGSFEQSKISVRSATYTDSSYRPYLEINYTLYDCVGNSCTHYFYDGTCTEYGCNNISSVGTNLYLTSPAELLLIYEDGLQDLGYGTLVPSWAGTESYTSMEDGDTGFEFRLSTDEYTYENNEVLNQNFTSLTVLMDLIVHPENDASSDIGFLDKNSGFTSSYGWYIGYSGTTFKYFSGDGSSHQYTSTSSFIEIDVQHCYGIRADYEDGKIEYLKDGVNTENDTASETEVLIDTQDLILFKRDGSYGKNNVTVSKILIDYDNLLTDIEVNEWCDSKHGGYFNSVGTVDLNYTFASSGNTVNVSFIDLNEDTDTDICFQILNESSSPWRCSNTTDISLTGDMDEVFITFRLNTTNSSKTPTFKSATVDLYTTEGGDSSPPTITAITEATTNSSCRLNWTTDEAANYTLSFAGTDYTNATFAAAHWKNVTSLTAETTYSYNITACDESTNCNTTANYDCVTDASPAADTCTYTSGDWFIDCSDNCVISDNYDLGGNSLYITGTGRTVFTGIISNFGYFKARGTDASNRCTVTVKGGLHS